MKIKEKFADRFAEHDKRIMEAHIKKEKNSLKKELRRLEDERDVMRDHLHRLEALIEKHDDPEAFFSKPATQSTLENLHAIWSYLETKLKDWENRFAKIWTTKVEDYSDTDREYAERELPLLRAEKRSARMRLRSMEEIIAKAHILADDLDEDLCRNFSGGRTLAGVGEIVLEEFGQKLDKNHSEGRQIIRDFLEKHCKISKAASRDLFSLLEEVRTFCYRVDIPEDFMNMPMTYPYEPEWNPELLYQLNGWWEIRA